MNDLAVGGTAVSDRRAAVRRGRCFAVVFGVVAAAGAYDPAWGSLAHLDGCASRGGSTVRWTARVADEPGSHRARFRVYGGFGEPALLLFELPATTGEATYCLSLSGGLATADRFQLRFVSERGGEYVLRSFTRESPVAHPSKGETGLMSTERGLPAQASPEIDPPLRCAGEDPAVFRASGVRLEPRKPPPRGAA
jgi:hypothetical protein